MGKLVGSKLIIDDSEDFEIRKIAYKKIDYYKRLIMILFITLIVMIISSFIVMSTLYKDKKYSDDKQIIEIKNNIDNILISNISGINETLNEYSFKENKDLTIEKINTIDITTRDNSDKESKTLISIKYDILSNNINSKKTNKNVLVRFSYSYDGEKWTYLNNAITSNETILVPLMGNYFDVTNILGTLNVITNYEIINTPGTNKKVYWRSETVFKNNQEKEFTHNYKANFKIEYNDSKY